MCSSKKNPKQGRNNLLAGADSENHSNENSVHLAWFFNLCSLDIFVWEVRERSFRSKQRQALNSLAFSARQGL